MKIPLYVTIGTKSLNLSESIRRLHYASAKKLKKYDTKTPSFFVFISSTRFLQQSEITQLNSGSELTARLEVGVDDFKNYHFLGFFLPFSAKKYDNTRDSMRN